MKKRILIGLLSLIVCSMLFGVQKNTQTKKASKTVIIGYVVSKGNVPFVYPAIKTKEGVEYYIECSNRTKKKLLKAQGCIIKFTGTLSDNNSTFILKKWKKIY